ncbi:hypothetical protein G6L68_25200 [Agrobacterium fabrum]|uniref:hypothetical protein n=1 Tax=Agrobacterium fabrum TaxID=1176649 RepID=UPI000EF5B8DA|nr:hypothetical protein [Agrobacterium fabrum]AYM66184.1 hypothetical protein At12D13_50320 [Agrobacterium fabrum]NTE63931.1 hypothetical protein [Agrobacterium fabrum]
MVERRIIRQTFMGSGRPKKLVIEWELLNAGEICMAHFPEPFPMSDAEYAAFEDVFRAWERRHWSGYGEVAVDEQSTPAALVTALQGLGYCVEHRGDAPPGILPESE